MADTQETAMVIVKDPGKSRLWIVERACGKLDRVLLPFCFLFSVIASIDRANLGFASIDLTAEIGLSSQDYGLGAGIFFLSYSLFQVPCNILFLYTGGPVLLGVIAIAWGVAAAAQAAISGRTSFLLVRLFLGLAEAGTVPGVWAYLAHMYPASHLTLPTTYYMAGITAAQALGAPLAAGLLSLHGAAGLSGWRWLFIMEGIPSVIMGVSILVLLPRDAAHCKWLTAEEQACLQETIDAQHAGDQLPAVASVKQLAGNLQEGSTSGLTMCRAKPTKQQIGRAFSAALKNRLVWCASFWRFLYALTLNSLIYFTPLIVNALATPTGHAAASPHSSPRVMLLTAVPYCAGVAAHLLNAYHSKKVNERRYHIALLWLWGGAVMCIMPIAWMHSAPHAAFALLVLSCVGVLGCDGIDISFILGLLKGMHPNQRVLGMAWMNTLANVGGLTGAYLLGYLKGVTGEYYAGCWLMGGAVLLAAACVTVVPQEWGAMVEGGSNSSSSCCSGNGDAPEKQQQQPAEQQQQHGAPLDGSLSPRQVIGRRASIVVLACAEPFAAV